MAKSRSSCYKYFQTKPNSPYALCKICNTTLKCIISGSYLATSSMSRHLKNTHPSVISECPKYSSFSDNMTQEKSSFSDKLKGLGDSLATQQNIAPTISGSGYGNPEDGLGGGGVNLSENTVQGLNFVLKKMLDNLTADGRNVISDMGHTHCDNSGEVREDQGLEEDEECLEEDNEVEEDEEDKCTILHNKRMLWFLELGKKKPVKQCELIKRCNLKLVKAFHKLIRFSYDKFHRVPSKDRPIFKKHKVFLANFMIEKDLKKKKKNLLRKVKGGFLSVLIPPLVALVSAIVPPFLGK